jgi:Tfp pilus assembly protein PilN
MAIMINLLPDVRLEKIREQQRRRTVTTLFTLVLISCGALIVGLIIFTSAQKLRISSLTKSISANQTTIKGTPNLSEILTLQQQLTTLPELYKNRLYVSKFMTIMQEVAPKDLGITTMTYDGTTVKANVTASSYVTAMKFVRALEASHVKVGTGASETNQPDFTDVTMSAVTGNGAGKVTYDIQATVSKEVTSASR